MSIKGTAQQINRGAYTHSIGWFWRPCLHVMTEGVRSMRRWQTSGPDHAHRLPGGEGLRRVLTMTEEAVWRAAPEGG